MGMTVHVTATCDHCKKSHPFDAPYNPPAGTPINQPVGWFRDATGIQRACSQACAKELQKVYPTAWGHPVKL